MEWARALRVLATALSRRELATTLGTVSMAIPLEQSALWAEAAASGRARLLSGATGGLLPADLEIDPQSLSFQPAALGSGAFGEVFLARWHGARVACKRLRGAAGRAEGGQGDEGQYLQDLISELLMWSRLHHPNICQLLGAVTRPGHPITLVSDFCPGGTLRQALARHAAEAGGRMPFWDSLRHCTGIAAGMAYLHSRRPQAVVHRDLKPANCLIDGGGAIKIADFGLSRLADVELVRRRGGLDRLDSYGFNRARDTARPRVSSVQAPDVVLSLGGGGAGAGGAGASGAACDGEGRAGPEEGPSPGPPPASSMRPAPGTAGEPLRGEEGKEGRESADLTGMLTGLTGTLKYMAPEV